MKITPLCACAFLAILAWATPPTAHAALLTPTCTAAATPVSFGTYDPAAGTPDDVTGTVTVSCSAILSLTSGNIVTASIALSTGQAGSFGPRKMTGPTSQELAYNLFSDTSHGIVWGDGSSGSATVPATVTLTGGLLGIVAAQGSTSETVYGQITAGEAVTAGAYSDTITVTVTY